jgi:hypothetical protein
VRAFIAAGSARTAPGRIASFELWDDLIRQPLCWLKQFVAQAGRSDLPDYDDPSLSITHSASENPEEVKLGALLNAWYAAFGNVPTTVAAAKLSVQYQTNTGNPLAEILDEIAGQQGKINVRVLGRWIERHAEQRKDSMRFVRSGKLHGSIQWATVMGP